MKSRELKTLKALPPNGKDPSTAHPPLLEAEPLHRRIARLTRELQSAIEALQTFNRAWAQKNIEAQAVRLAISTPELTFAANKRRELAARIEEVQRELGVANKERRALSAKASQKAPGADPDSTLVIPSKKIRAKNCPLKQHRQWPVYFELAAREELTPSLCEQIERTAKTLLQHALSTGVEEP